MLWIFVLLAASLIANERGTLLNNKAALHLHRAEYAQAEELFNAAIREFEATPDGSGDAATAMSNLGEVYRLTGRFREAEAIYTRALHSREQRLGAEDPLIANILNAMSCLNIDLGDPEAAEKVASRAVAIRERAGLTKDGQFAAMLHNLGEANRRLKRFDVAEGLFQRSLRIRQDIGGTESSDYASSLHHLGAVRQDEGRLEEGFELYSRALQIRRKLFGNLHPVLGPTLNNLALICLKRGDLASAKSYSEQAVALWKGTDSINLALSLMNLAEIHMALKDTATAEPMYRQSVRIWEKMAPKHPQFADCLVGLARIFVSQGRYPAAEKTLRLAAAFSHKVETQVELANVLRMQGRVTEAGKIQPVSTSRQ